MRWMKLEDLNRDELIALRGREVPRAPREVDLLYARWAALVEVLNRVNSLALYADGRVHKAVEALDALSADEATAEAAYKARIDLRVRERYARALQGEAAEALRHVDNARAALIAAGGEVAP